MVDELTTASESTTEHVDFLHCAIPLHQPSAAFLNSDGSSSDLICHPLTALSHNNNSSTGPFCVTSQLRISIVLPVSLMVLCVLCCL